MAQIEPKATKKRTFFKIFFSLGQRWIPRIYWIVLDFFPPLLALDSVDLDETNLCSFGNLKP